MNWHILTAIVGALIFWFIGLVTGMVLAGIGEAKRTNKALTDLYLDAVKHDKNQQVALDLAQNFNKINLN